MPTIPTSPQTPRNAERPTGPPHDTSRSPAAAIWIGGLGAQGVNEGLDEIAKRIAFACDRQDVAEAKFALRSAITPEQVGEKLAVPRATVLRTDGSGTRPILDLYGLPAARTLIGDRGDRSLLSQLGFAGRALVRVMRKAWKTRRSGHGKARVERYQLLYAWIWILVMIAGLLVLLGGLAATFAIGDLPTWLKILEGPILFFGGLGIWKSAIAKKLGSAALVGYSVVDYLDRGEDNGSQLRGQLAALLEHLAGLKDPHASIDVVTYSFGSIVAIDALFPCAQEPPPRLATINLLITIACPFDFVRSYWPDYFTKRFSRTATPGKWVNFYAPSDVRVQLP